jgi:UDP-glucose 4-epimerase
MAQSPGGISHFRAAAEGGQSPASLVTGGAGFLGAHVARALLDRGHRVVALDNLSGGFRENVPPGAHFVEGSVTDPRLVKQLFSDHSFEYVFHLAAYAAEGLSHFIRRFNYTNNVIGSVTLINEAVKHEVRCLVFTSSIAVYGSAQTPMTEATLPEPEDPYGIAKLAVEQDLRACFRQFGLNYIVFRPHNVYGEYQNLGDRYRNVVGIFMNQLMQGRPLTVFGDGAQTRAFSYVDDVAPYIARAVEVSEAYNEVFNIGADEHITVNELALKVIEAMGVDGEIMHLPARNEVVHAYADHAKVRSLLGVETRVPLEEGLRRMAAWAMGAGARRSEAFTEIEISKGLPAVWLDE